MTPVGVSGSRGELSLQRGSSSWGSVGKRGQVHHRRPSSHTLINCLEMDLGAPGRKATFGTLERITQRREIGDSGSRFTVPPGQSLSSDPRPLSPRYGLPRAARAGAVARDAEAPSLADFGLSGARGGRGGRRARLREAAAAGAGGRGR